jgi:hypothetical protein
MSDLIFPPEEEPDYDKLREWVKEEVKTKSTFFEPKLMQHTNGETFFGFFRYDCNPDFNVSITRSVLGIFHQINRQDAPPHIVEEILDIIEKAQHALMAQFHLNKMRTSSTNERNDGS